MCWGADFEFRGHKKVCFGKIDATTPSGIASRSVVLPICRPPASPPPPASQTDTTLTPCRTATTDHQHHKKTHFSPPPYTKHAHFPVSPRRPPTSWLCPRPTKVEWGLCRRQTALSRAPAASARRRLLGMAMGAESAARESGSAGHSHAEWLWPATVGLLQNGCGGRVSPSGLTVFGGP